MSLLLGALMHVPIAHSISYALAWTIGLPMVHFARRRLRNKAH
jgi:hypothetical protein